MTKKQKETYQNAEALREILNLLKDMKFALDCGHHVTFGHHLGNDVTIVNGKKMQIKCSLCMH